ncbi:adenine-specific DNA-methyltransferase [Xylanibacter ruminicola]|uniref:Adenine-specific DNA-methyltransferase n=1 Tax=Xylanibacter ruminicola TaxID=839 RepID=A0A1H5TC50_XYLRU|nr:MULTISPECIES: DNA methyltransferase [Prevotellaceae]SEF60343.1 adenine-specific DNA-methyltransferase [Xylanibacter ruminicola]SEV99530.1 adenine-specific DNA-methyltransferase [Prevotella sp. khp7]
MAVINDLIDRISDPELRRRINDEVVRLQQQKKFGLVFEEHLPEATPLFDVPIKVKSLVARKDGYFKEFFRVKRIEGETLLCEREDDSHEQVELNKNEAVAVALFGEPIYPYLKPMDAVKNAPDSDLWHTLIEADNYHALQLLVYLYGGMVDCIYIDPPYNTGARDWKYNNDYVDGSDTYRHSKWLSMMKKRLVLAKKLLNPKDSVLIVTIDEKEYLRLGCLIEELFSECRIQMVSSVINSAGVSRGDEFSRSNEYIFFIKSGSSSPCRLPLEDEWRGNMKSKKKNKLVWNQLMRAGTNARRIDRPKLFYPLYISDDGLKIVEIGEPLPLEHNRNEVFSMEGVKAVWPIRSNGEEGNWQVEPKTLRELYKKGYVRLGSFTNKGMAITYLKSGEQQKIENGFFRIVGYRKDGSVIEGEMENEREFIPGSQWDIPSHNATYHGSQLLNKVLGQKRFDFPKSLYAVHDTIRFFVTNKPNALIVDFFAGSGTTLQAVNLLNAEDEGNRRCIMVTNNEVSEAEAKLLRKQGYQPGDEEWEKYGIARYVNWPRTICSIEGHDINGQPLKGNYLGSDIPMQDGFKANAKFFKLGFLDKNSVAAYRQFRELLPLLWMKAGAFGECPSLEGKGIPSFMILDENKMAIMTEESNYAVFLDQMKDRKDIKTIFLVVDSEIGFREMAAPFKWAKTYQLYKDYLENFTINYEK